MWHNIPIVSVYDLLVRPTNINITFVEREEGLHRDLFRRWHANNPGDYMLVRGVMQGGLEVARFASACGLILTCPTDIESGRANGGTAPARAAILTLRHLYQFRGYITLVTFHGPMSRMDPPEWPEETPKLQIHQNPVDVDALIRHVLANGIHGDRR